MKKFTDTEIMDWLENNLIEFDAKEHWWSNDQTISIRELVSNILNGKTPLPRHLWGGEGS